MNNGQGTGTRFAEVYKGEDGEYMLIPNAVSIVDKFGAAAMRLTRNKATKKIEVELLVMNEDGDGLVWADITELEMELATDSDVVQAEYQTN